MRVAALHLSLGVALPCVRPVHAQVSAYATFSLSRISGVRGSNNHIATSNNGYSTSSFWSKGVGGGVTFNVLPLGPVKLNPDLRGQQSPAPTSQTWS
jgi:hypothetical protein